MGQEGHGNYYKIFPKRRAGREFEIRNIRRLEELIEVEFRICCSKGTYIRSLARDFGLAVVSGAYLGSLRRSRIGSFRIEDAVSIDDFVKSLAGE